MYKYLIPFLLTTLLLSACSGFFETDNTPEPTPLVQFTPEIQPKKLWSTRAGSGADDEYLKIGPAIGETTIFTTSLKGTVTAINKTTGKKAWQTATGIPLTTSPSLGDGIVVAASRKGDVLALDQQTGRLLWKKTLPNEFLATPAIGNGLVVTKATDGAIRAFSAKDGAEAWSF
ncbi:MAG TPA: PQQ-binding-like beta-propeller repeat protein, partial [Gammaproteobacteria bacterium]|nr:PQQ-binding-like beta-propeller repeat protein [Gammaproteobacteria bacterium]